MRSFMTGLLLVFTVMGAISAQGAEVPYDQTAFGAAVKAGQPVAVVFHANWCPTCRAQAPILKELMQDPKRRELTLYVADFDKETALRKELRVGQQSTLVVFKKGHEISRSTGDTQKDKLAALLDGASA